MIAVASGTAEVLYGSRHHGPVAAGVIIASAVALGLWAMR